jgi:hypothetical protein
MQAGVSSLRPIDPPPDKSHPSAPTCVIVAAMSDQDEPDEPSCPHCQSPMALVRSFPRMGGSLSFGAIGARLAKR